MLYLAFPIDLRDRFKESVWLAYVGKIRETEFGANDTLVVCEWMFPDRHALLQTLTRVRQTGARVVFIGAKANETDEFKRELCVLGIYDFLFVGDELILQDVDRLLAHGHTEAEVAAYLRHEEETDYPQPRVVDLFEGGNEPFAWQPVGDSAEKSGQNRFDTLFLEENAVYRRGTDGTKNPVRRFVWPDPAPVRVLILGDRGCGKSFIALQLLSLCHRNELPAAVIEEDVTDLLRWCDHPLSNHVYTEEPPKGYRVLIDTRSNSQMSLADIDLALAVSWPDGSRLENVLRKFADAPEFRERVVTVVNHYTQGVGKTLTDGSLFIPHEPRQFHAARMRIPLVELDPQFGQLMAPLVDRIAAIFTDPIRKTIAGGEQDALVAGV